MIRYFYIAATAILIFPPSACGKDMRTARGASDKKGLSYWMRRGKINNIMVI